MRVLIVPFPDSSHLYTAVPLAWALQGAGHEVRVASHPDLADDIVAAGLTGVALHGSADRSVREAMTVGFSADEEEVGRLTAALSLAPEEQALWERFIHHLLPSLRIFHPADADPQAPYPLADDLVGFARHWQPDLLLWDPIWLSGGVAAEACGALSVRVLWGPDCCGWMYDRFSERRAALPPGVEDPMAGIVRPMAERYGLPLEDSMLVGHWTIDQLPQEARLATSLSTIDMRKLPCGGAGLIPPWLRQAPEKPRIAFTLGASHRKYAPEDADMIGNMFAALAEMDVEVVATLNEHQLSGQRVPDNVHTFDYVPLDQLLTTCSMLIHHGGSGSHAAATALQVPQLVLSVDPVAAEIGKRVVDHGAGLYIDTGCSTLAEIRTRLQRILDEQDFQRGAAALYADWQATPSPNEVVRTLEELAADHRGRSRTAEPERAAR